ncbi:MAG: oxidative damage protection protein [Hahellaceae bacterium]|nr:oxidative damage protection protein [Hahellaceae bacterium]
MSRTVLCRKYKEALEGLTLPPMPGAKGQELYNTVSAKAWQAWLQHQTTLINEKHLNLMNPEHRQYLLAQMELFLDNEGVDKADGFVPKEG